MDNFLFLPRAIASALYDLAFASTVGVLLCRLWLPATSLRKLHVALITCAAVLLLSLAAQVILTTAVMTGTLNGVTSQIEDVLLSTHAGRLLIPALILSGLLLALSFANARSSAIVSLILLFTMAVCRSATGHAAARGDFTSLEALQLLHLTSTAIWAGSVMAAGLLAIPHLHRANDTPNLTRVSRRLSATATIAVFLVIASGIYNAWLGLSGSMQPLAHTQWGIILTCKSFLVTIAILLGLYNRILLRRNSEPAPTLHRFTRTLRIEAILITAVLILSAFLANSTPAMSS